ncbi:MAG: hypothetical protein Q9M39_04065 [Sulfurovum sp.]|nr:hypothetical protein [Sulfurovum sp.]
MKQLLLLALLIQLSQASTLNLKKVLASANNNKLTQAQEQERLYLEARNLADTASNPMQLYGTGARANPQGGRSRNEYSVGLSKTLAWGDTQEQEQKITRLKNEANLLEDDKKILNFHKWLKEPLSSTLFRL